MYSNLPFTKPEELGSVADSNMVASTLQIVTKAMNKNIKAKPRMRTFKFLIVLMSIMIFTWRIKIKLMLDLAI